MHADPLVRMANQIGAFFDAMPDRAEALEGIAMHIRRFWDPRMRLALLALVDGDGSGSTSGNGDRNGNGLSSTVTEAIERHREVLR